MVSFWERKKYNELLEQIVCALDEFNDVERLITICRGKISEDSEGNIQDTRSLINELENQNILGYDRLDILKGILNEIEKSDLVKEVEEFEEQRNQEDELERKEDEFERRKVQAAAVVSSVGNKLTGVLNIKTIFKVVAGGIAVVSTLEVLSRWSTFDQLVTAVNSCVLPAGTSLVQLTDGCVCLTVRNETLSALTTLWKLYQDGTLETRLYDFFVTDEVRERAGGEEVEVNVTIEEQEYEKACRELSHEAQGQETEDIERPRERRRRNPDPSLYCKAKDGKVKESKKETEISLEEKTKYLDSEREAFVQNYLQSIIHETHSMTTETSDSGIRTHGAPSDLDELENVTDYSQTYCLKDLRSEVIVKLQRALEVDEVARGHINESFGIRGRFQRMKNIFTLFPDTPVKLLKDVLETLQLYDLVDLLSEKPQPGNRSLQLALPLHEIENLRKTADNRPTTYHSSVAVLIIAAEENSDLRELKNFFEGLNSKSDVTIIECRNASRTSLDVNRMKHTARFTIGYDYDDDEEKEKVNPEGVQKEIKKQYKLQEEFRKKQKQIESIKTSASTVIDRWIHNQGNFSLFAVFLLPIWLFGESVWRTIKESTTEKLVSGIPDKIKLIIGPPPMSGREPSPETLELVSSSTQDGALIMKIFNKRWKTLDLISMMKEFKRTSIVYGPLHKIIDGLSSLPRFKKE